MPTRNVQCCGVQNTPCGWLQTISIYVLFDHSGDTPREQVFLTVICIFEEGHNQVLIGRDSILRVVICTKVNIRVRGWNLKQIDSCTFVAVKASATITCAVIVLMPPIARQRWNGDSYRAQSKFCCMTATEIWDQQESPVCAHRNILHTLREEEGTRKSCSGI